MKNIYIGIAIFIVYAVMVGFSSFGLGRFIDNFTMEEILNLPNIVSAGASAMAAIMSAIVAFLTYNFQKKQKLSNDSKALYFTIVQIAGLYNKINGLYLGHDNEKMLFKKISSYNKDDIFNENNEMFYNNAFSETFTKQFVDLITTISFWKTFKLTKEIDLLPDYYNAMQILITSHNLVLDVYNNKGYGDYRTFKIVDKVLLGYENKSAEEIKKDERRKYLDNMKETLSLVWNDFDIAYEFTYLDLVAKNEIKVLSVNESEILKDEIALNFLKDIIHGKVKVGKPGSKIRLHADNDVSKIYKGMLAHCFPSKVDKQK